MERGGNSHPRPRAAGGLDSTVIIQKTERGVRSIVSPLQADEQPARVEALQALQAKLEQVQQAQATLAQGLQAQRSPLGAGPTGGLEVPTPAWAQSAAVHAKLPSAIVMLQIALVMLAGLENAFQLHQQASAAPTLSRIHPLQLSACGSTPCAQLLLVTRVRCGSCHLLGQSGGQAQAPLRCGHQRCKARDDRGAVSGAF